MLWVMLESCQQNQDEKPAVPEKMPPTAAEIKAMKNAAMHSWLTQCVCGEILNLIGSNSSAKVNQLSLSNGWPHNYSNSKVWFGDAQGVMSAIPPWFHKWVRRYARNADSLSQAKAPKQATLMKDELERSIDIVMASVLGWWSSRV